MTPKARYLKAICGVRYWEDATVNGVEDKDGALIPCRESEAWSPLIELTSGTIQNWPLGTIADIHYKVCDDGEYLLLNEHNEPVARIDGYVIGMMCPEENGFGDYVIMHVDASGKIQNFKADLSPFIDRASDA